MILRAHLFKIQSDLLTESSKNRLNIAVPFDNDKVHFLTKILIIGNIQPPLTFFHFSPASMDYRDE